MPIITVNGRSLASLNLGQPILQKYNQQADTLSLTQHNVAFDAAPLFGYNTRVVAKSGATIVFTGVIVEMPRRLGLEETITYVAHGPWQWLSTYNYLQTYKIATDPTLEVPTHVAQYMGRVVMGQTPSGTRQLLAAALGDIISFAISNGCPIALGAISGFDFEVPWDQVSDITCAAAITRLLQSWAPDAVVWWDYSTVNPTINISRRAGLPPVNLPVAPRGGAGLGTAYVPFESIDMTPLYKDLASGVVLFFPKINSTGSASWITLDVDKYPAGVTGLEARALVRTVELTGYSSSLISQKVKVLPLAAALGTDTLDNTGVTAASDPDAFLALKNFWTRKYAALAADDVVIQGFSARLRKAAPDTKQVTGVDTQYIPDLDTTLTNEIIVGGVATWMQEGGLTRKGQKQIYYAAITYTKAGVSHFGEPYFANVMATNCTTKTYTQETGADGGDATPTGLAARLYAAVSVLHYQGTLTVVEQEASFRADIGNVVNLTGSLAEWSGMNALVQGVTIDFDQGRTTLQVGPPAQLGADSTSSIYLVNRTRREVTAALTRTTGLA